MDEATPPAVAFAVMAALWDRARTGRGGLVEFAQAENVMQDIGEFVLDPQLTGRVPAILGNTDPHLLQDVFACAGEDRWVAISIRDDADWAALRSVVGPVGWWPDGASADLRRRHSARLRAALAAWVAPRECPAVVEALVAARVPAGEVMTERSLLADPHLTDRGWFVTRSHPAVGTHRYPGHPWRATGFPTVFGRPVPSFGEDNEYVYRTLLGYPPERYTDLVRRRLVTTEQFA
jgi:crotonobetainyl-CoA:carnitine CoA-transferase CaiB-like acyl-CoA transferase